MGILLGLAGFVSVKNFLKTSPFAGDVYWDWWSPRGSIGSVVMAVKNHIEAESRRVGEMRKKKVDDMELRGEYRRAHGLEQSGTEGGFGGWAVKRSGREPGSERIIQVEAPGLRRGDWVDDQIRKAEEEAEKLAEDARKAAAEGATVAVAPVTVPEEPVEKKSSWW